MNKTEELDQIANSIADLLCLQNHDPSLRAMVREAVIQGFQSSENRHLDFCEQIRKTIDSHEDQQHFKYCGPLPERLKEVLAWYHNRTVQTIDGVRQFRDDLLIYFRALSLTLEMTGNASTHREKAARLRGAIEVIEHACEKLRREQFEFHHFWRGWPDIFHSDYPQKEYLDRIHGLEQQVEDLKRQLSPPAPTPAAKPSVP